ncbi:MAG: AMP-binding protein, partial [bacterium]|nr:AMP-binding protein [bacterium]
MTAIHTSGEIAATAGQNTKERDYWENKLSGEPAKTYFPYDTNRNLDEFKMENQSLRFSPEVVEKFNQFSKGIDYTLHMILCAGFCAVLGKYTDTRDILIGVPIYKQEATGKFINTLLPIRLNLQEHMTVKQLLMLTRQTVIEAAENQNYPIETLIYDLGIDDSGNDFPLFDIAILLDNIHDRQYLDHIKLNMIATFTRDQTISGTIAYNTQRYRRTTANRISHHLENFFRTALFDLDKEIDTIDIFSQEEKNRLLLEFNDTGKQYPRDKTIHRLFEEQVEKNPEAVAVTGPCIKRTGLNRKSARPVTVTVTYSQLNREANRLATQLRTKGAGRDDTVGILMERSLSMVIAILAAWKAGSAY